ncbi:MAG TPA: ABC transporter permease subunit, partial [Gemmataceae bacterium]|nr:ABC transporter permease subunit [Gemmataceae bacterium]
LTGYAAFHGFIVLFACGYAILTLRRFALGLNQESVKERGQDYLIKTWIRSNWCRVPILANRPMLWKEWFIEGPLRPGHLRRLLLGFGIAVLLLPFVHLTFFFRGQIFRIEYSRHSELMNLWLRLLCALMGCIALLHTLAAAAGSISGERDKQTLEELLATPLTNRAIFFAKWQSAIFRFGAAWAALLGLWCIGLFTSSLHPAAILAFLVSWFCFAAFLASLGIWFSVVCRTTRQATASSFLTCSVILGCALIASFNLAEKRIPTFEAIGLFPAAMLAYVTFSPSEWAFWLRGEVAFRPVVYLLDLSFWCVGSLGLFLAARSRFGLLTGRVEADSESAVRPDLPAVEAATAAGLPGPPWSHILTQALTSFGRRVGYLAVAMLPTVVAIAVYQVRAQRGEDELRGYLAQLDRAEPGWQEFAGSEPFAPEGSKVHETRAIMLRAEKLFPKDFPGERLVALLIQDHPDRELFPPKPWQTIQESRVTTAEALGEARKLGEASYRDVQDKWTRFQVRTQSLGGKLDRLLTAEGLIQLQEGHPDEALAMSRALVIMAAALGQYPDGSDAPHWLPRQISVESALKLAQRTLAQGEPSDAALAGMQHLLEKEDQPHLEPMLRAERARTYWESMHDQHKATYIEWPFNNVESNAKYNGVPALLSIDELVFLAGGASLEVQQGEVLRILTDNINGSSNSLSSPSLRLRGMRFLRSLADFHFMYLHRPASMITFVKCQLRATMVALALERYRRDHGVWPSSLDELTPAYLTSIPLGLFDGKPMIYKRLKDGVVVYTVGADQVDRGGMLARESWGFKVLDIGVRLWDVSSRRQQPSASSLSQDP